MFAGGPSLHSEERVLKPVPGLGDASIEDNDEYIMPMNVVSAPEPQEAEWTMSTKESMPDDVPIVGESDDDRPLINPIGLSIKKPDDEEGDGVHRETTTFTDTPGVGPVPEKSPPPAPSVLSTGQISFETIKPPDAEKILVVYKRKKR